MIFILISSEARLMQEKEALAIESKSPTIVTTVRFVSEPESTLKIETPSTEIISPIMLSITVLSFPPKN